MKLLHTEFNQVLKNIDIHFRDPESDLDLFRRPMAILTAQINLFHMKECEQFGMSAAIYKGIMACSKTNKIRFDNEIEISFTPYALEKSTRTLHDGL